MPPTPLPEPIVVDANTAEEALTEVTAQLGADAEIVKAELVPTGGIAGFFAKETIRITAQPRSSGVDLLDPPPAPATAVAEPLPSQDTAPTTIEPQWEPHEWPDEADSAVTMELKTGIDAALERMVNDVDGNETTFQEALKRHLSFDGKADDRQLEPARMVTRHPIEDVDDSAVTHPTPGLTAAKLQGANTYHQTVLQTPTPPRPAPAPTVGAAPGSGLVTWSISSLMRLGLPTPVIESVMSLSPRDDLAWITAIADAVTPYCRRLPQGSEVIAGPRAQRFGWALDLPVFKPPELPPYGGSFIAAVTDATEDIDWLEHVRGDRWLHLAVDDESWEGLVIDEPIAVSWTSERGIAAAIALAATTGAVLGYGMASAVGSATVRANPLDVAFAVRSLMERE